MREDKWQKLCYLFSALIFLQLSTPRLPLLAIFFTMYQHLCNFIYIFPSKVRLVIFSHSWTFLCVSTTFLPSGSQIQHPVQEAPAVQQCQWTRHVVAKDFMVNRVLMVILNAYFLHIYMPSASHKAVISCCYRQFGATFTRILKGLLMHRCMHISVRMQ